MHGERVTVTVHMGSGHWSRRTRASAAGTFSIRFAGLRLRYCSLPVNITARGPQGVARADRAARMRAQRHRRLTRRRHALTAVRFLQDPLAVVPPAAAGHAAGTGERRAGRFRSDDEQGQRLGGRLRGLR
jgi:hypothetical protein